MTQLAPEANRLPSFLSDEDHRARGELRDRLSRNFAVGRQRDATLASHGLAYARVRGLMANDHLFDLGRESQATRDRYGHSLFGQQALVARRLVEGGVPFVRLTRGWWDSHGENFDIHAQLVPDLDQVLSALLDDLDTRGLLRNTLVITFSEMGRTPTINSMRGRDHWGTCWSVTLSGCGIKGGAVHGSTNAAGTDVAIEQGQHGRVLRHHLCGPGHRPSERVCRSRRPAPGAHSLPHQTDCRHPRVNFPPQ